MAVVAFDSAPHLPFISACVETTTWGCLQSQWGEIGTFKAWFFRPCLYGCYWMEEVHNLSNKSYPSYCHGMQLEQIMASYDQRKAGAREICTFLSVLPASFHFCWKLLQFKKIYDFTYTESAIHQDSMGQGYICSAFLPDCLSWYKFTQNWVNQRWFLMKLVERSEYHCFSFPNFLDYFVSIVTENFKIFSSCRYAFYSSNCKF